LIRLLDGRILQRATIAFSYTMSSRLTMSQESESEIGLSDAE